MNSKHTPGPWACLTPRTAFTNRCCPIEADGVEIAKVWCDGDEFPEHVGEANARLIARAPELLEFARLVAEYGLTNGQKERGEDYHSVARALIAEIEGGEAV